MHRRFVQKRRGMMRFRQRNRRRDEGESALADSPLKHLYPQSILLDCRNSKVEHNITDFGKFHSD